MLFAIAFQFYARYVPAPAAVLAGDDWVNLARATLYPSYRTAAVTAVQDPNRPLSMLAVEVLFRWWGDRSWPYTVLSILSHSALLVLGMWMLFALTASRLAALIYALCFSLLPNVSSTFHWSTQIINEVSSALVFYAASGLGWVLFVRRGSYIALAVSVVSYGIGLFSYEVGAFLPAAFFVLARRDNAKRLFLHLLPFAGMLALYAAWRLTNSFGMNHTWCYPPHMQAHFNPWALVFKFKDILSWWFGENMWQSWFGGVRDFAVLHIKTRRMLLTGNVTVLAGTLLYTWRLARGERSAGKVNAPFSALRTTLFGLAWAAATHAPSLIAYTSPQMLVLPAMGLAMALAVGISRLTWKAWASAFAVAGCFCLMSSQGNAVSWKQSGLLQERIYEHLKATKSEWEGKEYILLDTRMMRQRLTMGLTTPASEDFPTWAYNGNALMLRGFVSGGMAQLIEGTMTPRIKTILDVEYGAHVEGERLVWHDRYNYSRDLGTLHSASISNVFVVDCFRVGCGDL